MNSDKQLKEIESAIRATLSNYFADLNTIRSAQETTNGARQSANRGREYECIRLAALSIKHGWDEQHIKLKVIKEIAAKLAPKYRRGSRSADTFCGQIYRAIHPKSRDYVRHYVAKVDQVWDPKLEAFFKRRFFAVFGSNGMLTARINGNPVTSPFQLISSPDPRRYAKRDLKNLAKIAASLEEMIRKYPGCSELPQAVDINALRAIDLTTLTNTPKRAKVAARATAQPKTGLRPQP